MPAMGFVFVQKGMQLWPPLEKDTEALQLLPSLGTTMPTFSFRRIQKTNPLTLYHSVPTLKMKHFENIVRKGENAGDQHFLFFQQCFLPIPKKFLVLVIFILSSENAFNLDHSKNFSFGKELSVSRNHIHARKLGFYAFGLT